MTRIDPVSAKVLALLPATTNGNLINNGSGTNLSQRTTIIPSLKLDQSIDSKSKISFFWSKTFTDSQFSFPNGNADGLPAEISAARGTFFHYRVFRLNYDYTLTPTLLLHLGAGYNQINAFDDAPYLNFNAQQQLGLPGFEQNRNFPDFNGASSTSLGGLQNIGTAAQIQSHTFQEKPTFNANATWVRDSHTYKAGGEVYFQGTVSQPFAGVLFNTGTGPTSLPLTGLDLAGQSMGFGFASFLLGDYSSIQQNAPADYRLGKSQWGIFLQDSWKVNRKLTLDYGLRWITEPTPRIRSAVSRPWEATCRIHRRADAWEQPSMAPHAGATSRTIILLPSARVWAPPIKSRLKQFFAPAGEWCIPSFRI
jgi:hypothetical protein